MAKKSIKKTNAMRLLDTHNIEYEVLNYICDGVNFDGKLVAEQVGLPHECVFKTLVTKGEGEIIVVCVIPVNSRLDLKQLAAFSGHKHLEMINVNDILKITGYVRGGCSPLVMKKQYPTYIDESILSIDKIAISAGVRGQQIYCNSKDLLKVSGAQTGKFSIL